MGTELSEWVAHPVGGQPEVEEWSAIVDTFGGRVHIESITGSIGHAWRSDAQDSNFVQTGRFRLAITSRSELTANYW